MRIRPLTNAALEKADIQRHLSKLLLEKSNSEKSGMDTCKGRKGPCLTPTKEVESRVDGLEYACFKHAAGMTYQGVENTKFRGTSHKP